jgi:hypothetical protein
LAFPVLSLRRDSHSSNSSVVATSNITVSYRIQR